jgi:thiol-disulfide isomerase/thioredoxin
VILLRALGALLALLALPAAALQPIDPGTIAPDAAGIVINGPEGSRLSALRGRVVVLDFWASWCGPCRKTLPELDALRRELHAQGFAERFEVLGVSVDQDVAKARRFLAQVPVAYPMVVDQIGIATQRFGLWRLPSTMLIEPDGRIHYIYWGYGEDFAADLRQRVLALLALPPPAAVPAAP